VGGTGEARRSPLGVVYLLCAFFRLARPVFRDKGNKQAPCTSSVAKCFQRLRVSPANSHRCSARAARADVAIGFELFRLEIDGGERLVCPERRSFPPRAALTANPLINRRLVRSEQRLTF
jgi:hypothetical protein